MKFLSRLAIAALFPAFFGQTVSAQNISGVINSYAKIHAIDTCTGQVSVSSTAGFQPGGAVILVQVKGATISSGNNSDFGKISAINSCGLFEENEIASVIPPNVVFLKFKCSNKYDALNGAVQLVTFPKYTAATIADTLFPKKWDGQTGGILAISAQKLTFHAPIDGSGRGFRGGTATTVSGNNCNWANQQDEFTYGPTTWRAALKGEGIAPFISDKEAGKGPQGNGGGGGNDHNSGGGGGANTQPGGKGGKNEEPANFGCDGKHPGLGGIALPGSGLRLFMGGGGGAGHGNNNSNGGGGAGGAIIIMVADSIDGLTPLNVTPTIWADGLAGGGSAGDGAGGGGAGGTVLASFKWAKNGLALNLTGGVGGSNDAGNQDRCQGPGGGGAGGQVYSALGLGAFGVGSYGISGNQPGAVFNSTDGCNGSSNGGTKGGDGVFTKTAIEIPASTVKLGPLTIAQQPVSVTACEGESPTLSVIAMGNTFTYQWWADPGTGWAVISPFNTNFEGMTGPVLTILDVKANQNGWKFRCKLHPTACSGSDALTGEVALTVLGQPNVSFTYSVNNNLLASFTNGSLNTTNYLWDFGDGSPTSPLPNPGHTYQLPGSYTVMLTGWNGCDTVVFTQTITAEAAPLASFSVPDPVFACGNSVEVEFVNGSSGNITGQSWQFPGGVPSASVLASPKTTYSASGNYSAVLTVTGASGTTNSFSQNFAVELAQFPTATFTTGINGQVVTFTNSSIGGATFFWDFGDGQTATGFNVVHSYPQGGTWVVTLVVENACGASVLQKTINLQWSAAEDLPKKWGLRVFPNPTAGDVFVETEERPAPGFRLQLIDLQGVVLFEKENFDGKAAIDLRGLAAGAYFLKITGADGQVVWRLGKT